MPRPVLVDDHEGFLDAAERLLARPELVAVSGRAASGVDAVRCCDELRPDVGLLDLAMPGMGGPPGMRLIRRRRNRPPSSSSVMATAPRTARAVEAGAGGLISKPSYVQEAESVLRDLVDRRGHV